MPTPHSPLDRDELTTAVRNALEPYVTSGRIPGLVSYVAHSGEVVHELALGVRDVEAAEPMTTDTLARIYSMTKPVTSVAVMMLIERGDLALEDRVDSYLPEFSDPVVFESENADGEMTTVPADRPITIEHLLTHTSGLTYGILGGTEIAKRYNDLNMMQLAMPLDEFSRRVADIPLVGQPGERFNYGVSTAILGRVIEVVSGQSFDQFMADNVTRPLGMNDTAFFAPPEKLDRFAKLYTTGPSGDYLVMDDNKQGVLAGSLPALLLGDGGLVSTAPDFARFCQMILNKGELDGVRLLEQSTVELMTQDHLPASSPYVNFGPLVELTGIGFGYGFAVSGDIAPELRVATGPGDLWWGGYSTTVFWIDPTNDLVCILMGQQVPPAGEEGLRMELQVQLRQAVYGALAVIAS